MAGTSAKVLSGQLWPCPRAEQGHHGEEDLIPSPVGWSQRVRRFCHVSPRIPGGLGSRLAGQLWLK